MTWVWVKTSSVFANSWWSDTALIPADSRLAKVFFYPVIMICRILRWRVLGRSLVLAHWMPGHPGESKVGNSHCHAPEPASHVAPCCPMLPHDPTCLDPLNHTWNGWSPWTQDTSSGVACCVHHHSQGLSQHSQATSALHETFEVQSVELFAAAEDLKLMFWFGWRPLVYNEITRFYAY